VPADSRETVLARLWAAAPGAVARPDSPQRPAAPGRPVEALQLALEAAGGALAEVEARRFENLAAAVSGLDGAEHVWSAIPEVASSGIGCEPPDMQALAALDFTVLPGVLAVAESGAVWNVPRSPMERAAALLAEHLVLVVERRAVVGNLHDAYRQIDLAEAPFGWFLSGPSKTADIEQSLVLGAHGPRRLSLVLV